MEIIDLPNEILGAIVQFLDIKTLCTLRQTNRRIKTVVEMFIFDFRHIPIVLQSDEVLAASVLRGLYQINRKSYNCCNISRACFREISKLSKESNLVHGLKLQVYDGSNNSVSTFADLMQLKYCPYNLSLESTPTLELSQQLFELITLQDGNMVKLTWYDEMQLSDDMPHYHMVMAIAKGLANSKIIKLCMQEVFLRSAVTREIARSMKSSMCNLQILELNDNGLEHGAAIPLIEYLSNPHCKIKELHLGNNAIGNEGAIAIANAMKSPHCRLEKLDVMDNNIDDAGVTALAMSLFDPNNKLTHLILNENNIGDQGCQSLAMALTNPNCYSYRQSELQIEKN